MIQYTPQSSQPSKDSAVSGGNALRRTVFFIAMFNSFVFSQVKELPLKALFLEAAVRFITWPTDSTHLSESFSNDYFTVGIFKNDKFTHHITQVLSKKNIKGVFVRFKEIKTLNDIDSCNLVYIPSSQKRNLSKILHHTRNRSILTVGDQPDCVKQGVILSIVAENQRISCYINETEAARSHLGISHHLLKKSKVVSPRKH